jgi:hypothetical protein
LQTHGSVVLVVCELLVVRVVHALQRTGHWASMAFCRRMMGLLQ